MSSAFRLKCASGPDVDFEREAMSDALDQTFEDIRAQMKRLGLDSGNLRYRNPLDLLEEARKSRRRTVATGSWRSACIAAGAACPWRTSIRLPLMTKS